jgi:acetyltransferase-like isoleucine patch superfamily enzyme
MSEVTPIRVPLDNVNDERVKLVAWRVKEGQEVQEGQLLAEVETSKALVEMMAPVSGKVWLRVQAGHDVDVGAVVAFITKNGGVPPQDTIETRRAALVFGSESKFEAAVATAALPEGTSFSKKALELIEVHGIPLDAFAGRGMIREQSVREYLEESAASSEPAEDLDFALKGLPLDSVTLPAGLRETKSGFVDPQFLEELKTRTEAFGTLSSSEKCDLYRKHGAIVGEGAVFGPGTVVVAPQIIIGEEAQFDDNSMIRCRERFCAGRMTRFRRNLTITGRSVILGENIWGGKNVQIGGGGNGDPWSLLCVGDDAYLGDDIFLNICRPILIGKEVFLTQRSILVTHNIGQSVLEGYENRFAPVVLGDYSQIGMNTTIYAGCNIGRSAIVTSNSYVIGSIPAGKLAMGVPARVVRDAARPLDRSRQLEIVETMMRDYHELLLLKGCRVSALESGPVARFSVDHDGKRSQILFTEKLPAGSFAPEPAGETVIWTFDSTIHVTGPGYTVMNLLSKQITGATGVFSDSTREFLRKRGIRCKPGPWRYRQGLI